MGWLVPFILSHISSLSVSPFFSPLSLRHGFVVVCFEVTICELLYLDGCAMCFVFLVFLGLHTGLRTGPLPAGGNHEGVGRKKKLTAAPCDLEDPGWGDPSFPHALLLCSP